MLCFQDSELPDDNVIENNLGLYICVNVDGIHIKKALILLVLMLIFVQLNYYKIIFLQFMQK